MKIRICHKCKRAWGVSRFDKHKKKYICPKCNKKALAGAGNSYKSINKNY